MRPTKRLHPLIKAHGCSWVPNMFPVSPATPSSPSNFCDPIPTKFVPPCATDTPDKLLIGAGHYIRRANRFESVIFTDGACLGNGLANSTAGCGIVISPHHRASFRLENSGPTGETRSQTSNRAELRAAIAALEYWNRHIITGAESRLIIATDSEYVVLGITEWIHDCIRRGWRTSARAPVKNQDLWKELINQVKKLRTKPPRGTVVSFWKIPREWNVAADESAKKGALLEETPKYEQFTASLLRSVH